MAQAGSSGGAPPVLARAHHGSVSKEQRAQIEEELKVGRLPAVVATSSLELGIDMGAVDLVIQVESPPSVASGLQRIGRAGHQVGAVSKGVVFPKYRGDLLQTAVVAERMVAGAIESTADARATRWTCWHSRSSPCALSTAGTSTSCSRWSAAPRRSPRCRSRRSTRVLDMLAGRYPSDDVRRAAPADGLGPGHRGADRAPGRAAARGHQRRHHPRPRAVRRLPGGGEGSPGSASSTRRWSTSPASATSSRSEPRAGGSRRSPTTGCWSPPPPAQPGRLPFWHGDSLGRPVELGRALGRFRARDQCSTRDAAPRLAATGLDESGRR